METRENMYAKIDKLLGMPQIQKKRTMRTKYLSVILILCIISASVMGVLVVMLNSLDTEQTGIVELNMDDLPLSQIYWDDMLLNETNIELPMDLTEINASEIKIFPHTLTATNYYWNVTFDTSMFPDMTTPTSPYYGLTIEVQDDLCNPINSILVYPSMSPVPIQIFWELDELFDNSTTPSLTYVLGVDWDVVPNQNPIANPETYTIAGTGQPFEFTVLSNDVDPEGDILHIIGYSGLTGGSLTIATTPEGVDYFVWDYPVTGGIYTFTYEIEDYFGATDTALVTINWDE